MNAGKLGFGFMRLPVIGGNQENIDFDQLNRMVDTFIGSGYTYFDTSFAYHNGKSEDALKRSVVERYPREKFTIATKFPTFILRTEDQVEPIFAQQLQNLGSDYVDYYLLHILNTKFYNGEDGKGGVVKTCHLFEHARKWKEEGKIKHLGFSFHDSPEVLDQILTEHPEVEFVQIIINYFDWNSYFIASKGCYDVIRKHGKDVVVMEPVKGGVLAKIPDGSEKQLRALQPELSPAGWALRYAGSKEGVIAVLSGMSTLEQVQDNVGSMKGYPVLSAEEQSLLEELAAAQKAEGPEHTADFRQYESLTYHGISVAAILDTYNSAMVQPNPLFSGEMNYLANRLLSIGKSIRQDFPAERVVLNGEDITTQVETAWRFLVEHAFVM
ncbi:MAG: aldo/keto reductase [Oscillospiraceae bacterium]|nr:aldo/keto reductase [Oscillospiraceae bacterium]